MLKGTTFSDLHLLAQRQPDNHWEEWMQLWRNDYDLCILNGDVFDFRWSKEKDRIQSLRQADHWLRQLITPKQRATFVVLQGNHDSCPHYQMILKKLASEFEHFHWQEHWWVLGDKIFLHGDAPDLSGDIDALQQYRAHHLGLSLKTPNPFRHWLYKNVTRIGLTGSVTRMLPWKQQCERTDIFLKNQLGKRFDTITDVYLGHTHVHYTDYEFAGRRYHNCGAPFRGAKFHPSAFEFTQEDWGISVANPLGIEIQLQ